MNLIEKFDFLEETDAKDCASYICPSDKLVEVLMYLRDEAGFRMLADLTAVDNGVDASPRFKGIYHVVNMKECTYLRLTSDCVGDETPTLPSATTVFSAADWHERETFDMFGIEYTGHPDLRRILMWDEFKHFPLRKDYPLAGIEDDYPEEDVVERTDLKLKPAPMMGGPFVSSADGPMSDVEPRAKDESWSEGNSKKTQ